MSNNSNDPLQNVTIEEIQHCEVSITPSLAYIFIGKTPRAQLCINLPSSGEEREKALAQLGLVFPNAKVSIQKY